MRPYQFRFIQTCPALAWMLILIIFTGCRIDNSIDRQIAGIKLGDTVGEVGQLFRMQPEEDAIISLLRDFGASPEASGETKNTVARWIQQEEQIASLAKKETFALKGQLPTGIKSIHAVFVKGFLYQINLYYEGSYMPWSDFTGPAIYRFGQPARNEQQSNDSYVWSDKLSRLEMKHFTNTKEGETYAVLLTDVGIDKTLALMRRETERNKPLAPFDSLSKEGQLEKIVTTLHSIYFLPGDYIIYKLMGRKKFAAFFETGDYGGTMSFFLSALSWLIGWGFIMAIIHGIKDFNFVWFKK